VTTPRVIGPDNSLPQMGFPALGIRCVPISQDGPPYCFECGADLFEIGEFSYVVRRDLWLAAVPWEAGGMFNFLCIGCLEDRLGRQLTADDFPDDIPMNFDSRQWRSERLQARRKGMRLGRPRATRS
jgi:hypothetical protein